MVPFMNAGFARWMSSAASSASTVVGETSVPQVDAEFTADRPFFFGIRDLETDVWLFFGRLADPS
jgi:serine protease inhibitor